MKIKYLFIFFLLFIIISSSINVSSQIPEDNEEDQIDETDESIDGPRKGNLLDWFLWKRFQIGLTMYIGRYFNYQLIEPTPIKSFPDVVDIQYLNETTIQIGGKDPSNPDEWQRLFNLIGNYNWGWIYNSVTFKFDVIYPENISEDALTYYFEPNQITISPNTKNLDWEGVDNILRTNLTFELRPPRDPTYPTQDFILQIKVTRIDASHPWLMHKKPAYVNIWNYNKNIDKINENTPESVIPYWKSKFNWLTYPITGISLWSLNKKNNLPVYHEYLETIVNVLVRVQKDHFAELEPPEPVEIHPDEILTVPVTIKNLGSHLDTYNFRIKNNYEEFVISQPSALTLESGEEREIYVAISAPPRLTDLGKTISITVEAYSIEDPETVFSNKIILTTAGIYLSIGIIYYVAIVFIFLLILLYIITSLLKRHRERICKKPDKPWEIAEEKKHLENLKEKDKEKYNETRNMMKDEYESSLLWHKYYCQSIMRYQKNKEREQRELAKQKRKEEKEKKIAKEKKTLKPPKLEKKKIEKKVEKKVEKVVPKKPAIEKKPEPKVDKAKQRLLLKIKKNQEKQKRKVGY